jgi:hypothetical protein
MNESVGEAVSQSARQLANVVLWIALTSIACAVAAFYFANTPLRLFTVGLQLSVYGYMLVASDNKALKTISIVVFALCLPFGALNGPTSDFKSLIVPFCFLGGIGCAWYALEFQKTRYVFEYPFYLYLAMTVYLIVVKGYGPEEFNEFYAGISRNGYSAILFATACGYVISRTIRNEKPSVLLLAASFASAFPLYGRSSIVALALLFGAAAMKRWPRLAVLIAIGGGLMLAVGYLELQFLESATNFKAGIESDRWAILDEYASALNPRSAVLGVDLGSLRSVQENDGSPDMALLRLHSYLGLSMFFILVLFASSAIALLRRRHFLLFTVLVAVMFRALTDIILLFGTVDLFFMPVLFFPYFLTYWNPPASTPLYDPALPQMTR